MTSFRTLFPELSDNQLKLLERAINEQVIEQDEPEAFTLDGNYICIEEAEICNELKADMRERLSRLIEGGQV